MKEFLTSHIFPYWLIFGLVAASLLMMWIGLRTKNPQTYLRPITGCMLAATTAELLIYWGIGNSALWWCTSDEYGFFAKLLRLIPFALFLVMQVAMIWLGKMFIETAIEKEFSMKSTFWGILLSYPITLVIVIVCSLFGMSDGVLSIVSAVLFIGILSAGIGYALQKKMISDEMIRQSNAQVVYRDEDGHLHYTSGDCDAANRQIAERKAKE